MKHLNGRVKSRKIHLKSFPGAKASQLNYYIKPTLEEYKYNCAIIYVGINDILRNNNDTDMNNLPESILEIQNTCQNYNIAKIFISTFLPSKRNNVNISQINETLKHLCSTKSKTVFYGTETVSYIAPKSWIKVPETIKMRSSLESFKSEIQKWKLECDYHLCTTYLHHVGFTNVI